MRRTYFLGVSVARLVAAERRTGRAERIPARIRAVERRCAPKILLGGVPRVAVGCLAIVKGGVSKSRAALAPV